MNEDYKAECTKDSIGEGTSFRVTHNGNHWTAIRIEDPLKEVPLMILALQGYLAGYVVGMLSKIRDKYQQ